MCSGAGNQTDTMSNSMIKSLAGGEEDETTGRRRRRLRRDGGGGGGHGWMIYSYNHNKLG